MAEIDSRIALGVQPLDVGAAIGKGYQLRDLAAQADARQLDTQIKQQAIKKQGTLADLHRLNTQNGKLDRAKFAQGLADAGYGQDVGEYQKQWSDADKAEAEHLSKNSERIIKTLDYTGKAIGSLLSNPNATSNDVIQQISGLVNAGLMTQEEGARIAREVPGDPAQLRPYLMQKASQAQQAKDMLTNALPQLQSIKLGGTTQLVDTNPMTNPQATGQTLPHTATPGEMEQQRHNRATEERAAAQGTREQTQIVTDADGGVQLVDKRTGQAVPVTGADGQPVIGKGGLSQEQLKNASAKKQTVDILRTQLENLKKARAGLGGMDYGVVAGRQSVTDSARAYDGALAALQSTVRQLTRTPGEGAMSDFESRLAMAQLPGRVDPASVIDQKITQLEDLANIVERGYTDMLSRDRRAPAQQGQPSAGGVLSPKASPVLDQAKAAIAAGADRAKVIERLKGMGVDTGGL